MKKLYLHIGTHKTGTKSIQSFLYKNRKILLSQGYLYPETGLTGTRLSGHHQMAWQSVRHHKSGFQWEGWQQLKEEIANHKVENVALVYA